MTGTHATDLFFPVICIQVSFFKCYGDQSLISIANEHKGEFDKRQVIVRINVYKCVWFGQSNGSATAKVVSKESEMMKRAFLRSVSDEDKYCLVWTVVSNDEYYLSGLISLICCTWTTS